MRKPISANDLFGNHIIPVMLACGFIGVFVVTVPIVYMLPLPASLELMVFGVLFILCHLANWPMMRLRWQLWFDGSLTPYAAMCTTALLVGSFGIPFILLADLIH